MRQIFVVIIIGVTISFSSCALLVRSGVNMAGRSIQTAADAENPTALQQATLNVTSQASTALQSATANNPMLQSLIGVRTQAPPQGAQETICNENPCFTSTCGQFELLSVTGDACTGEVVIVMRITQRQQQAPIRHPLGGIIAIDEEGNSYEMIEATPENLWRNLPYNVPVRVEFRRVGPVPTSVTSFIYLQAACWSNSFQGLCSPIFRNVPITWTECPQPENQPEPIIEESDNETEPSEG